MQTWLSRHYYPNIETNECLNQLIRPFFESAVWPTSGARSFFVRYMDEKGPHLRLRFKGETEWMQDQLIPAFNKHFEGDWQEVSYEAEPQRFGGPAGLALAEEHFHISTRVVLDRLIRKNYDYGDTMFDALRLNAIALFAAGVSKIEAKNYFEALTKVWIPNFFSADGMSEKELIKTVTKDFEQAFEMQQPQIAASLRDLWTSMGDGKIDTEHPEWLRWLRGNELIFNEMGGDLDRALPNLLHLTNNRLGVVNHDEAYLVFMLSRAL